MIEIRELPDWFPLLSAGRSYRRKLLDMLDRSWLGTTLKYYDHAPKSWNASALAIYFEPDGVIKELLKNMASREKTKTHFSFRVDTWTPDGENIVEHVAGVEDYEVAR